MPRTSPHRATALPTEEAYHLRLIDNAYETSSSPCACSASGCAMTSRCRNGRGGQKLWSHSAFGSCGSLSKGWNKPQDEIIVWPIETLIGPGDLPAEATKRLVWHGTIGELHWRRVLGCPPVIFVLHIARIGWYLLPVVMPHAPGAALSCSRWVYWIFTRFPEFVLGRRQIGAALRIPAPVSSHIPLN